MRWLILGCLLSCPLFSAAQSVGAVKQEDSSHYEMDFKRHGSVRLHIQSCALQVSGSDEDKIKVHYWSDHDKSSDAKVEMKASDNTAEVSVSKGPHNNFHVEIQVPKVSDLYLRMMAGQVDVDDVTGDKDVKLSAGQITIEVGDAKEYREAEASVYTGELDASPFGVSKAGLF